MGGWDLLRQHGCEGLVGVKAAKTKRSDCSLGESCSTPFYFCDPMRNTFDSQARDLYHLKFQVAHALLWQPLVDLG